MSTFYTTQDLRITLTMGVDVTGGSCRIKYKTPGGTTGYWAGTISLPLVGAFYYDASPAVLTAGGAGLWTFWGYVTFLSGKIGIGRPVKIQISAEGT